MQLRIISLFFLLVIVLTVVSFTMLNPEQIEVKYIIGTIKLPLAVICFIALAFGMLLGVISMVAKITRLKKQNYLLRVKIKQIESRIPHSQVLPKSG